MSNNNSLHQTYFSFLLTCWVAARKEAKAPLTRLTWNSKVKYVLIVKSKAMH